MAKGGFDDIDIKPTRVCGIEKAWHLLVGEGIDVATIASEWETNS